MLVLGFKRTASLFAALACLSNGRTFVAGGRTSEHGLTVFGIGTRLWPLPFLNSYCGRAELSHFRGVLPSDAGALATLRFFSCSLGRGDTQALLR